MSTSKNCAQGHIEEFKLSVYNRKVIHSLSNSAEIVVI